MMGRLVMMMGAILAACIEPNLTHCPGGYDCPGGTVCDLAHQSCVDQSQLDACKDMPDLTPCTATTVSGECFDMVCLEPGCGNRVVEAGEECDDGNHISGDGCSLDCTSTETCGNNVLDVAFGEQCDDGNLANHDGCNSRCVPEQPTYTLAPIRILDPQPAQFAYDRARDRLVFASQYSTWEWDGSAWQIAQLQRNVVDGWYVLAYDETSQRVVGFGQTSGKPVVATWDGTTWTMLAPSPTAPNTIPLAATFHPPTAQIAVVTATQLEFYDLATNTWKGAVPLPFTASAPAIAYDKGRAVLTMLDTNVGATWDYGSDFVAHATLPPGTAGWALTYNQTTGHLIAVGGVEAGPNFHNEVSWLDDTLKWSVLPPVVAKATRQVAWVDRSTGDVMVYGGTTFTGPIDTMFRVKAELDAIRVPLVEPNTGGSLFYDSIRHRLVMVVGTNDPWTHTPAGWIELTAAGTKPTAIGPLVFDPVRQAALALDGSGTTWQWDATQWKSSSFSTMAMLSTTVTAYDYDRRAFVSIAPGQASSLASSDSAWMQYGEGIGATSAAYDLGNHDIVVLGSAGDSLADLVAGGWQLSLSPGPGYVVTNWLARKSIVMVPRSATPPIIKQVWERRGATFSPLGQFPIRQFTLDGVSEDGSGALVFAVRDGFTAFLIRMQLRSDLPDETCAAGEDADGDGLSGCDDADCWETCWPQCPYSTSCS